MIEPCRLEGVLKRLGRLFALANIGIKQQMEVNYPPPTLRLEVGASSDLCVFAER